MIIQLPMLKNVYQVILTQIQSEDNLVGALSKKPPEKKSFYTIVLF